MSADAQSSFLQYLSGFVPGFKLSLPQAKKGLQCIQEYVSAGRGLPWVCVLGFCVQHP